MKQFLLCLLLLVMPSLSRAACHVVTQSGSGALNGNDWSNAFANLPGTFVSGDTYFVADGTYGTGAGGASIGQTNVTIKKAIPTGASTALLTHCTDVGWLPGTMGSAQAIFTVSTAGAARTAFYINANNVTIDGNGSSTGFGCTPNTSDCGFKIDSQNSCPTTGSGACNDIWIDSTTAAGSAVSGVTVRYVQDEDHPNSTCAGTGGCADTFFDSFVNTKSSGVANAITNVTISHCYTHNVNAPFFLNGTGINTFTLDHNWTYVNQGSGANHTSVLSSTNLSTLTVKNNLFEDFENTGGLVALGPGAVNSNWLIYGNVFLMTSGNPNSIGGQGDGAIACINGDQGVSCPGWKIYQNDFINISTPNINGGIQWLNTATGDADVRNNIWYSNTSTTLTVGGQTGTSVEHHNSLLNNTGSTIQNTGGTGDLIVASGSANPFVNWTKNPGTINPTPGDFHLATEDANWTGGDASLSSPYNADPDGRVRGTDGTWERGAFELQISGPGISFSPTSLSFGNQTVNTASAFQETTLTNSGTTALTITSISLTGANTGDFTLPTSSSPCPISPSTLAASATCTIRVTFTPLTTGARSASVSVADNAAGSPHTVPLTGTGTGAGGGNKGCAVVGSAILVKGTCQ
jgi:hypothetical protein